MGSERGVSAGLRGKKIMTDIIEKLQGGDRRSIGRANEVVRDIQQDPTQFEAVFAGLSSPDPVVRMRAADVIEKVTQTRPELLNGYTAPLITLLTTVKQQELCWHLAQLAPRLVYSPAREAEIIAALKRYLTHQSKIVQVSTLTALTELALRNRSLRAEVIGLVNKQMENGSPAVQARSRKLLKRLSE